MRRAQEPEVRERAVWAQLVVEVQVAEFPVRIPPGSENQREGIEEPGQEKDEQLEEPVQEVRDTPVEPQLPVSEQKGHDWILLWEPVQAHQGEELVNQYVQGGIR